jgi:hypothetical protein
MKKATNKMKATGMCIKSHKIDQKPKEISSGSDPRDCCLDWLADQIRARAYQLFEDRGRQLGQELDDWLQAEQETKQHLGIQ